MPSTKFASCVILSYLRPDVLRRSLQSLRLNTSDGYPHEILLVDDGSRGLVWPLIQDALRRRYCNTAVFNADRNRGVGEGIRRGFALAQGDYLLKLDADLLYHPGWLDRGVAVLDARPDVGMVGFFDYRNYVPTDERFNILSRFTLPAPDWALKDEEWEYGVVDDFVSSAFMIRRNTFQEFGPLDTESDAFAEDVMYKRKLQAAGLKLAITIPDFIENFAFGLGKSVVVTPDEEGKAVVTQIEHGPTLFGRAYI